MFDASSLSALLSGVQSQQPAPVAPAPAPPGPFGNLSAILNGDANYGSIVRQIGGGLANMGPTGGDPYLAFAQGFGGTQTYATAQEKEAADRAAALAKQQQDANLALQRLTQDQSQHSATLSQNQSQFDARTQQDQTQFDQRMTLDQAAEKRAQQVADATTRKTEAEIARLAKREDVDPNVMMKIEDAAQQAGKNAYERNPSLSDAEVRDIVNSERDRMVQQVKSGRMSDGPGVTEADTTTTSTGTPKVGDVVGGYEYIGGDPSNQASWKIQ